jgi:hypothetical protein
MSSLDVDLGVSGATVAVQDSTFFGNSVGGNSNGDPNQSVCNKNSLRCFPVNLGWSMNSGKDVDPSLNVTIPAIMCAWELEHSVFLEVLAVGREEVAGARDAGLIASFVNRPNTRHVMSVFRTVPIGQPVTCSLPHGLSVVLST